MLKKQQAFQTAFKGFDIDTVAAFDETDIERLVRKLCPSCRTEYTVTGKWRPVGCLACNRTGYQGRTGIYEIVTVDD